jgi:hypothetical protein
MPCSTIFHFTKGSDAMPASQGGFPKGEPEALAAIQALGLRVSGPLPRVDNRLASFSIAGETNISPLAGAVPVECGFLSAADINPAWRGPLEMRCQRRDWGKTEKWSATKERASKPLFDRLLRNRPANHVRHVSRHANRQLSRGCHTAGQKHRHPATRLFEITPFFAPFY